MIKLKYHLNGMYRGVCPACHTIIIVPERMVNAERETKCKCEAQSTQEPIQAVISEYHDYGTYVWVDYGDGEELARALEEQGTKVTRIYGRNKRTPD